MASALWLGESLKDDPVLAELLALPVQVNLLPWHEPPAGCYPAGKRLLSLPLMDEASVRAALRGRDIYFLAVEDFSAVFHLLPGDHGHLLALGTIPPPEGVSFCPTPTEELTAALCKRLPSPEPNTFYISGDEVRCSIEDEDFAPLLERMRGE